MIGEKGVQLGGTDLFVEEGKGKKMPKL